MTRFIREDLGIEEYDDKLNVEISAVKSIIPKSQHEYACITLSESNFNVRLDQIETPHRFFLGGTTAETQWRDLVIPELKNRGLEYFDPRVEDWNDEARKREEEEKEKCDTMLFLITPEMKGIYSIAEIINSTWQVITSGSGFVYFGILGSLEDYREPMWRSLMATLDMVKEIAQGNSRIKVGLIGDEPIKILDL